MRRTALTLVLACAFAARAQVVANQKPESPRLSALQSALESGRGDALDEF